jgi:hypothetical protein
MSTAPTSIYLTQFMGQVYDQADQGACVPNAMMASINLIEREQGKQAFNGSRDFVYWNGQEDISHHSIPYGTVTSEVLADLETKGVAPESMWSYNDTNALTKAPDAVYQEALKHTITSYDADLLAPAQQNYVMLNWIVGELKQGKPVQMDFNAKTWLTYEHGALNTLHVPVDPNGAGLLGGHCTTIVGYDAHLDASPQNPLGSLIIQNSWGTGYGDNGLEVIPLAEFPGDFSPINGQPNVWELYAISGFEGVDQKYTASKAQVSDAYTTILQRAPEAAGMNFFSSLLDNATVNLDQIYDSMFNSSEGQAIYGGMSHAQIVTQMYRSVLNRDPDAAGFAFFLNRLDTGACTPGQMYEQTIAAVKGITSGNDLMGHDYLLNKEDMGEYYSIAMQIDGTHSALAHNIISQVTSDANQCQIVKVGIAPQLGADWNVHS